jgi:hypothetical protein
MAHALAISDIFLDLSNFVLSSERAESGIAIDSFNVIFDQECESVTYLHVGIFLLQFLHNY